MILAYYDNFDYGDDKLVKSFYKAMLYEEYGSVLEVGDDVPLTRSILAVPITGSLIIEARLTDFESGEVVLNGHCVFCSKPEGSFKDNIKNEDYTLEVDIDINKVEKIVRLYLVFSETTYFNNEKKVVFLLYRKIKA